MRTAARWPIGRGRVGRRLGVAVAVMALSIGCVADASLSVVGPGAPIASNAGSVTAPTAAAPTATAPVATPVAAGPAAPPATSRPAPPPATRETVPVLYYHRVEAVPAGYAGLSSARKESFNTYDVLPVAFAAQLDWLVAHGYTTILPGDLIAHWDAGTALPAKPVIISFDDGSHDWVATVLPMLEARGMVAEFYLTLQAIDRGNLTWKQVRRLAAAGNGIGAHDVHHVQLAGLAPGHEASAQTMWSEVSEARRIIGLNVGVWPDSMAYVGGGFDATLERAARDAGYTSARTILRGVVQYPAARYRLRVVRIGVHDDVANLVQGTLVAGLPTFTARMAGVSDKKPK